MSSALREPVAPATQMAVLPFVAAVEGHLRSAAPLNLRITMHRVLVRNGEAYLQQTCPYLGSGAAEWPSGVGRVFPLDERLIGSAYRTGQVWGPPIFESVAVLEQALREQGVDPATAHRSWLALPFLGPTGGTVLIMYADCDELNFFADSERAAGIAAMGYGFCRLFDSLESTPFEELQNYPLPRGIPTKGAGGMFSFQKPFSDVAPPRFQKVLSFNYESAA
jgi:hypothetical protein